MPISNSVGDTVYTSSVYTSSIVTNNIITNNVNGVIVKDHAYIYVKTTGDDTTGDGSGSKPFKTIQKAVDSLVDFVSPNTIYIFVGSGTYTENVVIPTTITGSIMIQGDTTHPENVVVKSASAIKQVFDIGCPARVSFAGMKIQDATSSFGVLATNAWVGFYNVQFYNNKTSVSSLSGSRVSFLGSSLGVSTIDGNDIASSYGITSDSTSIINIAQNLVIDNVDYGILNQSSSAYISSNVTITAKKIVWWSDKGAYNYIAGTQTFTGGGSGSSIFKLGHSELDFVSATLNMSTADYGFYGETGVKISEVGGTFNYEDITKEVYLDYDTVLDTTDSLSATPEYYKAADEYGFDDRYLQSETDPVFASSAVSGVTTEDIQSWTTTAGYVNQDVKTTSSPTFVAVNTPLINPSASDASITAPDNAAEDGHGYSIRLKAGKSTNPDEELRGLNGAVYVEESDLIIQAASSTVSSSYNLPKIEVNGSVWDDGESQVRSFSLYRDEYVGSGIKLSSTVGATTTYPLHILGEGLLHIGGRTETNYTSLVSSSSTAIVIASASSKGSGWGEVMVGDNEERARFSWTAAGVITLMENTANVVNTDTDEKFCILSSSVGGVKIIFKNRLGSTKTVKYVINY